MAEFLGVETYLELNTPNGIWTSRASSHIVLKDVPDYITGHRITEAANLIDRTLRRSAQPPAPVGGGACRRQRQFRHGGDRGHHRPTLRHQQLNTTALAVRTVFLAKAGEVDGIITMYHDRGRSR